MTRATVAGAMLLLVAACAASVTLVTFRVTRDPAEDPFPGASAVEVAVRQDGVLLPRSRARTELASGAPFATPTLPFGAGYTLRVDVLDGELLLARGTSTPFEVTRGEAPALPDVFVAPLGRFAAFAEHTEPAPDPVAASLSGQQVIVGNADGSLWSLPLATGEGAEIDPAAPARRFLPLAGGLLTLDGDEARFVAEAPRAATDARLSRHGAESLLVAAARGPTDAPCAYVVGGRSAPQALTRVCALAEALALEVLPDVGEGGWGGAGACVSMADGSERIAWVGRRDADGTSSALTLVDPDAPATVESAALDLPTVGALVVAHGAGEVLVVGGRSALGVVRDEVARVVVQPGGVPAAVRASPSPEPLFLAREGASASVVAGGVYLVYGGRDEAGLPVRRAELVDVRAFPGVVAPTGELPTTAPLVVVPIDDHAQLAVTGAGVFRYASPRGFP